MFSLFSVVVYCFNGFSCLLRVFSSCLYRYFLCDSEWLCVDSILFLNVFSFLVMQCLVLVSVWWWVQCIGVWLDWFLLILMQQLCMWLQFIFRVGMLLFLCLCCFRFIRNWLVWVDRWCSLFSFLLKLLVSILLLFSFSGGILVMVLVSSCVYVLCLFSVVCRVCRCGEFSGVSILCMVGSKFRLLCRVEKL